MAEEKIMSNRHANIKNSGRSLWKYRLVSEKEIKGIPPVKNENDAKTKVDAPYMSTSPSGQIDFLKTFMGTATLRNGGVK